MVLTMYSPLLLKMRRPLIAIALGVHLSGTPLGLTQSAVALSVPATARSVVYLHQNSSKAWVQTHACSHILCVRRVSPHW